MLPFDNFSADNENSYFVDGFQDNILTDPLNSPILKLSAVTVPPHSAVEPKKAREIGHVLGVSYVLEGNVRNSGDRVRVNAQLINTRTEAEVCGRSI